MAGGTEERCDEAAWSLTADERAALRERCRRLLGRVPSAVVSHRTALHLHELPVRPAGLPTVTCTATLLDPGRMVLLPRRLPVGGDDGRVHVTVPPGTVAPERHGVVGHRAGVTEVVDLDGLPVASPVDAWLQVAGAGAGAEELVVVGDALARRFGPAALRAAVEGHRGRRGARLARLALRLVDARSPDADTSRLRVLLLAVGLGPLAVAHEVLDSRGGRAGVVPLAWPAERVGARVLRPQGALLRDEQQVLSDRRLLDEGWTYVDVLARELVLPARVAHLVRSRRRVRRLAGSGVSPGAAPAWECSRGQ